MTQLHVTGVLSSWVRDCARNRAVRCAGRLALVALGWLATAPSPVAAQTNPVPVASIVGLPADLLIGESHTFTVSFDNTHPTQPGFGPYVDLVLPSTGADGAGSAVDDGITFVSATYLGVPVTSTVLTFNGSGNATHPYAVNASGTPLVVTGTPGDQLVVLQLPFGSFTADQPAAALAVTVAMSNQADAGAALTVRARGGFRYGRDALDNPPADPSTVGSYATAATTPTVLRLTKTYVGPEDETATGPNFPRQYRVRVDIANGQLVTALDVTDALPPSLQFVSVDATTVAGVSTAATAVSTPSTTVPGGTLTRRFTSVTGTAGTNDAEVLFTYYVPRVTSANAVIINAISGDDATSVDDARASGQWDPIDPRDAVTTVTSDATVSDHTLTDKSIAIQKSAAIVTDSGPTGASPGDVVEYALAIQISDFFAFQSLVVTDVVSDGQRRDGSFTPTLSLTEHGAASAGAMAGANYSFAVNSPGTGETTATFRVSNELVTRSLDGIVLGGCVPVGGTGGPVPDCGTFNAGGATATIRYRVIVQENFTDTYPSGDTSVDQGDVLSNSVTIAGDVLGNAALVPTGQSEADTSGASLTIVTGSLAKSIYAVNGSTSFSTPLRVSAGDTVTYRLVYTLPASDTEPLTLTDFLPLPIFTGTEVTTFDNVVSAGVPVAGHGKFGPSDTFRTLSGLVPTLAPDPVSNAIAFQYVAFDDPLNQSSVIDILFTVTVSNAPFADGLFLTNQVRSRHGTTNASEATADAIIQLELTEPDVYVTKGVVAASNAAAVFSPSTVGPVTFTAPGSAGFRGGATITSTGLVTNPINSNVSSIDAGDRVTFAIVLENRGNGLDGAFDVQVRDTIPTGFLAPANLGDLNLRVTTGDGTVVSFVDLGGGPFGSGGGLFGTGLELVDGVSTGGLAPFDPSSGANLVVITYDLQVASTVRPSLAMVNTATLFNFSGTPSGPDFTTVDRTDTATATVRTPGVTKTILSTNQVHTTGNNVAVGEQLQYQLVLTIPEGSADNVQLVDTLDAGLAFVSLDSIAASSGAVTATAGSFASVLSAATISNPSSGVDNAGRRASFSFGTLTNSDTDNSVAETITITYTVVVINGNSNDRGDQRNNSAAFSWTGASTTGSAPNVTMVEPELQVAKSVSPAGADAGDTVTFTVTLSHTGPSNADAFNATLADVLPAGLGFVSASHTAGLAPTTFSASGGFSATWTSFPDNGSFSTFQIQATLPGGVAPGQQFTNTANAQWTSLPGDVLTPQSTYNTLSTERTGNTSDPGGNSGADNDHRASGSAVVTVTTPSLTKTIVTTSAAHTTGTAAAVGERVQYQVVVQVPEGVSSNAALVDTFDAGLALVSVDSIVVAPGLSTSIGGGFAAVIAAPVVTNVGGGSDNDGRRLTLSFGTVTNSDVNNLTAETITLRYTAVVLNTAANARGASRGNTAVWTSDSTSATGSAPVLTIVEPTLSVTKTMTPATADVGGTVTVTLVVSHAGGSNTDAFDAVLTDVLPTGLTFAGSLTSSAGVAPTTLAHASGTITAAWTSLPAASSSTITFQATVASQATPGQSIANQASTSWSSLPGVVIAPQSPYNGVSSERTGNTSNPGGAANTYLASASASISLRANSIAGRVYVDADDDGTIDSGETGLGGVTITVTGTDLLGATVTRTVQTQSDGTYQVTDLPPGTYRIVETQPSGYFDGRETVGTSGGTVGADEFSSLTLPAGSTTNATGYDFGELPATYFADIAVAKTVDILTPNMFDIVTFTVTATNLGPQNATGVRLVDSWPAGLQLLSATPSQGTYQQSTGTWSVGALATSASATLQVQARVVLPGQITNTVTKVASDQPDPVTSNNTAAAAITPQAVADVRVQKSVSNAQPNLGTTITFTIVVDNAGPNPASGVVVVDRLPAGLTYQGATASQGSYEPNSGVWQIGALAVGQAVTLDVSARVDSAGMMANTATKVAENEFDPVPQNDSSGAVVNGQSVDVQVVKTVDRQSASVGDTLTFSIVATNNGPSDATNVRITEALPANLTFVSATPSVGSFSPLTGVWAIPAMPVSGPASSATLTVVTQAIAAGTVMNTAIVTGSDQPDTNAANNVSAVGLSSQGSDVDLSLEIVGDGRLVGSDVDFFATVTNRGVAEANGLVTVVFPLPENLVLTMGPMDWDCVQVGQTVSCSRNDLRLASNGSSTVGIWTRVVSPSAPSDMMFAGVTHAGDTNALNNIAAIGVVPGGVSAATTPDDAADVSVRLVGTERLGAPGGVIYTAVVTNHGPAAAHDVSLSAVVPAGLSVPTVGASVGSCATTGPIVCTLGTLARGDQARVTFVGTATAAGAVTFRASASARAVDLDMTNNNWALITVVGSGAPATGALQPDTDGDGMPDAWESMMGLDPSVDDAAGDPDADGITNLQEAQAGTHPRGFYRQYFAEGASNGFFRSDFALFNPSAGAATTAVVELLGEDGVRNTLPLQVNGLARASIDAATIVGAQPATFSTVVESDRPLVADRTMSWDARGYGSSYEIGQSAPSLMWYFAEGATHSGFQLFYLVANPTRQAAEIEVSYFRADGTVRSTRHGIPASSRLTIWANQVEGIEQHEVSAQIASTNGVPVVAERAMYHDVGGQVLGAGHVSAGVTSPSTEWVFAEGATGAFFDEFLLLGNPSAQTANVELTFLLPDGSNVVQQVQVAPISRLTLWVDTLDPRLANTPASVTVRSLNGVGIVAERAMWWAGAAGEWREASATTGATSAGTAWAVAGGDLGAARASQTYLLVANTAATDGRARITLGFEDGTTSVREFDLAARSRTTIDVAHEFPAARGRRFGALVESVGASPVPVVVEMALYSNADGQALAAGAAGMAKRLR